MKYTPLEKKIFTAIRNNEDFFLLEGISAALGYSEEEIQFSRKKVSELAEQVLEEHPRFFHYKPKQKARAGAESVYSKMKEFKRRQDDLIEVLKTGDYNCVGISSLLGCVYEQLGCEVKYLRSPFHIFMKVNGLILDAAYANNVAYPFFIKTKTYKKEELVSLLYGRKAQYYLSKNDKVSANHACCKALKINPKNIVALIHLNNVFSSNPKDKIDGLLNLTKKFRHSAELYLEIAIRKRQINEFDGAEKYAKKALKLAKDDARIIREINRIKEKKKDFATKKFLNSKKKEIDSFNGHERNFFLKLNNSTALRT